MNLSKAERTDKAVLEQVIERRRLQQSVILRDIGRALNMSVGAIHNSLKRLAGAGRLKAGMVTIVEVGPVPTTRGLDFLKKAG